jgi:hypothetical protein
MDITQITKCEFEYVYNKYAPSKLEKFYFKYFSTNTLPKNLWLKWVIVGIMLVPFIFAFTGTIVNASQNFIGAFTYFFCGLLACFSLPWIYVFIIHKFRIKKIQKELGVNAYEYDFLVDKFYNETVNTFIKNKLCQ